MTVGEFLLGKQLPYVVLAFVSFLLLVVPGVLFGVPVKGSLAALALGGVALCRSPLPASASLLSMFVRTQIAAIFGDRHPHHGPGHQVLRLPVSRVPLGGRRRHRHGLSLALFPEDQPRRLHQGRDFADFYPEFLVLVAFGVGLPDVASRSAQEAGALSMAPARQRLPLGLKELRSLATTRCCSSSSSSVLLLGLQLATGVKTEVSNARSPWSTRTVRPVRAHARRLPAPLFPAPDRIDPPRSIPPWTAALHLRARHPAELQADILPGRQPALQLNIDATAMTQAGSRRQLYPEHREQEIPDFLQARGDAPPSDVTVIRANFNPNLEGVWFPPSWRSSTTSPCCRSSWPARP